MYYKNRGSAMTTHFKLRAYGKINLGLDVLRKREDGYHEVKMIMQTVGLFDQIDLFKSGEPGIRIETNLPYLPVNENNLVYQAARLLMEEFQIEGLNCADRFFVEEVGNFSTSLMSNVVSRIAVDATKKSQNNKNIQKSKPSQSTSNNNQKTTGTPDKDVLNEIHNRFFVFQGLTGPTELDNTIYINNLRRALG